MADKGQQQKFRQEIQQMMYVSGETGEPSAETTSIIEEIVRQQVLELLRSQTPLPLLPQSLPQKNSSCVPSVL